MLLDIVKENVQSLLIPGLILEFVTEITLLAISASTDAWSNAIRHTSVI